LKEKYPELPNYKVEVKNINSFRYAKRAIEFEIDRHREILEQGETPVQETRGYDSDTGTTVSQRVKEEAADYRYFPEPDIPTFEYSKEELDEIYNDMPILPYEMLMKFIEEYGISEDDAYTITRDRAEAEKVMEIIESAKDKLDEDDKEVGQIVANYYVNKKINPKLEVDKFVAKLVEEEKPVEVDEDKLSNVMEQVISENQKAVDDYTSGSNPNAIMYLVGQVMKDMQGQADAQDVKSRLEKKLSG
jgi:aspartyl-tRNA(Asn)/glutamyl-tRNA(Gln) amidotransferase subunit B